jgi:predicted oxidoreductase
VDLECDSRWSAGGLHQQINKDESRRMTRRQGVDIANSAWKMNECEGLDAFWGKRSNKRF